MSTEGEDIKMEEAKPSGEENVTNSDEGPKPENKENSNDQNKQSASNEDAIKAIADRLKFFFSDANVRQDAFMRRELMRKDGSYPHMVTVEKLLRFNTIKEHSKSEEVVVTAAKTLSDTLTVSNDEKAIGRVKQFTLEQMDENIPLSLHLRNLPYHGVVYQCKSEEIRDLFSKYGKVALVKLRFSIDDSDRVTTAEQGDNKQSSSRKGKKRLPIGAALVEFETIEELQKAAEDTLTKKDGKACEPPRKLILHEKEIEVMLLSEYIDERKKLKAEQEANGNGDNSNKQEGKENKDNKYTIDWKPGCVIRFKGVPEDCSRETIVETISKALEITADQVKEKNIYVDYSRGQKDGAIRFDEPSESVKTLRDKLKEGLEVGSSKLEDAHILEGDEENEYWKTFIDFKNQQMSKKRGNQHNKGSVQKRYKRK